MLVTAVEEERGLCASSGESVSVVCPVVKIMVICARDPCWLLHVWNWPLGVTHSNCLRASRFSYFLNPELYGTIHVRARGRRRTR